MKKTKQVKLVLITALFASCHHPEPQWHAGGRTYIRSDSTAPYALMPHAYSGFGYRRLGYYSGALSEEANIGHSSIKSGIVRGGFGRSALSVES
jgi:hypothetical protein